MSQITRCPSCSTLFKVVADQLRISGGWVCCGHCREVFDATEHLMPQEAVAQASPPPPPPSPPAQPVPPPLPPEEDEVALRIPDAASLLRQPEGAAPSPGAAAWSESELQRWREVRAQWAAQQDAAAREQAQAQAAAQAQRAARWQAAPEPAPAPAATPGPDPAPSVAAAPAPVSGTLPQPASHPATPVAPEPSPPPASAPVSAPVPAPENALPPQDVKQPPFTDAATEAEPANSAAAARTSVPQPPDAADAPAPPDVTAQDAEDAEAAWADASAQPAPPALAPSLALSLALPTPPDKATHGEATASDTAREGALSTPPAQTPQQPQMPDTHEHPAVQEAAPASGSAPTAPAAFDAALPPAGAQTGAAAEFQTGEASAPPDAGDMDMADASAPADKPHPPDAPAKAARNTRAQRHSFASVPAYLPASAAQSERQEDPVSGWHTLPPPLGVTPPAGTPVDFVLSDMGHYEDFSYSGYEAMRPRPSKKQPQRARRAGHSGKGERTDKKTSRAERGAPSFVAAARRRAFWTSPPVRRGLWGALAALALALLAQALISQRDWLAARQPGMTPLLNALCQPLGCRVRPYRDLDAVVIDSSTFHRAGPDAFAFSVTLRNRASWPVATPALELTLTDAVDQPVVRRVLSVQELGAPPALPARDDFNGARTLTLHGVSNPAAIVGYRLVAFYP